jgi:hypothetical protein
MHRAENFFDILLAQRYPSAMARWHYKANASFLFDRDRKTRRLVDRIQHLMPSFDCGDDFIGISVPDEWLGVFVCVGEEAFDGGLEIDERAEDAAFEASFGQLGEVAPMALSHDAEVGV